jgi:hypothetical protein
MSHLPIVGIEIEGSGPSTKTLTADVVNIVSLGTRLGLLVVIDGRDRMYRRAVRIIRTMRRAFGDIGVIPCAAEFLTEMAERDWEGQPSELLEIRSRLPAGGEGSSWLPQTRSALKELGEAAGFIVVEPYIPPILEVAWSHVDRSELEGLATPADGTRYRMRRWNDYFTGSQIDLAWLLPLPKSVRQLLTALTDMDDTLLRDEFVYPQLYDHAAVIGFEFESNPGKHAAGGLANLSAYCTVGVAVGKDPSSKLEMERALKRYQPTLGLRNVIVRSAGELSRG